MRGEKQRRYRERQKRGSISVRVDVPPQAIPALVALGLLYEHQPGDRQAIRAALDLVSSFERERAE